MEYKRVTNDINGNPRYVVWFMEFISKQDEAIAPEGLNRILYLKNLAVQKAKSIGGKAYKGRDFGGGIVFQSYNIDKTFKQIKQLGGN